MRTIYILNINIFSYRHVRNEYITNVPTAASEKLTHFTFLFPVALRSTLARASSFTRFPDYTQLRITVGRTPLDE